MTGNKKVRCNVCYREMRSDNVKRHMKQHTKKNESNPVTNISVTNNYNTISGVSTERKDEENENKDAQTTIDEKALEIAALKINKEFEEEVELGKALYKILNKGVVQEESFPPEWQRALDLYLKQGHQIDHDTVVLKPWQMELMKHIDNPSDRKILWVQGEKCGEGKTWFQKYVQSLLGRRRVVAGGINIHSNSASIAHALSKRPLATTDIFLFNIGNQLFGHRRADSTVLGILLSA